MASETGFPVFIPVIFAANPLQEPRAQLIELRERVIFINALTQTTVVVESSGESSGLNSLIDDLLNQKTGRRPASRASIDAMPTVEVVSGENSGEQCAICLEGWEAGETAKEMPCKHRFHGDCIERWLNINGTCPICRYQMPKEEEKIRVDEREMRGGIRLSFGFGGGRRSWEDDRSVHEENREE